MKKILIVTNIYPTGNNPHLGTFVRNIKLGLDKDFITEVICLTNSKNKIFSYLIFYLKTFYACLFKEHDLVYIHYTSHSSVGVLLARVIKRFSIISHVHGSDILREERVSRFKFYMKRIVSTACLKLSKYVISPSDYYKFDILISDYNIKEEKIFVSPSGGVDLTKFIPNTPSLKTATICLGFVGRLTEDKGILDFLFVLKMLKSNSVDFKAVIVGNGPLYDLVSRVSYSLNIQLIQKLEQEELVSIYNALDVFIFPSRRKTESLGLVGIEALACDIPVIAYDFAGPSHYINSQANGILVDKFKKMSIFTLISNFDTEIRPLTSMRESVLGFDSTLTSTKLNEFFKEVV
ncbi:TPA: glycosyltransferase family 4 protein [Vibrio parahaemolyticus]